MVKCVRFAEFLVPALTIYCVACESQEMRSIDPEIQQSIDDFVNNVYFPASKISKMGLAIVKNNSEILYSTGYGMADEEKGILNGNQTQFLIGSITKSFTATVVIKMLHERFPEMGEAVLDTPVMKLMPTQINFTLIDRFRSDHFTFRDLLAHRMCIPRHDLLLVSEPFTETSELVYRQRYAEQACDMRSEFQYNNQMYVVAGELVGILANKSYSHLVNELLLEIGMYNSNLTDISDDFSKMPFRAQPYYVMNGKSYKINQDLVKRVALHNAAGGLFTTPNDMVKYMNFLLNKGKVDDVQIIPKDVMSWLTKPAIHTPKVVYRSSDEGGFAPAFGYSLGMTLAFYDGWEYNLHGGAFSPYKSMMSLFPSQNLGIFTSSNEGPQNVNSIAVHAFVFEILRGTSSQDAIRKLGKLLMKTQATSMERETVLNEAVEKLTQMHSAEPTPNPTEIVGKYGNGALGDAEILMKLNPETNKTGMYIQHGKWLRGWMEYLGGSIHKITWDTDVVQDYYAAGYSNVSGYAGLVNGTLKFYSPSLGKLEPVGIFRLGVNLDNLPIIPWDINSC